MLSSCSHAGQQTVKPPMVAQRRGQTCKICFSQLAPLSLVCRVQACLVGAQGGIGLWLRPVCPCCWHCCDGCPPWCGHLPAPSPQGGGWGHLTLPDAFQKPFPLEKEGYFGGDDLLAGRRQPEEKSRIKKNSRGHRQGIYQGIWIGAFTSSFGFQDNLARVSPSGCLRRRWDGKCMCPLPVPLSMWDNSPWRESERMVDVGGDRSVTCVSWWTRILEMVYCLGRRV